MMTYAAALLLGTAGIAVASPDQALTIDLGGAQPRVDHLNAYESDAPVHVRVVDPKAQTVAIEGTSPDGTPVDQLLTRNADGSFSGDLSVGTTGEWSLSADVTIGSDHARTEPFSLTVVDPTPGTTAGLMIALGGASVFGGVGLLAVGRRAASRQTPATG